MIKYKCDYKGGENMEMLDIYDENNNSLNFCVSREEAHINGLWHRHVSSWIMNKDGKILLERRSKNKKTNPNMWSRVGGHVESGETVEEAIIREINEEIGIEIPIEEAKLYKFYKSNNDSHFFAYIFVFVVDYAIEDYVLQKEEVDDIMYIEIEKLEEKVFSNDPSYTFIKWDREDFKKDMNYLKECRINIK